MPRHKLVVRAGNEKSGGMMEGNQARAMINSENQRANVAMATVHVISRVGGVLRFSSLRHSIPARKGPRKLNAMARSRLKKLNEKIGATQSNGVASRTSIASARRIVVSNREATNKVFVSRIKRS
ncbi:MAG: hypothetical protein AB7T07_04950 [Steroidobacteraceae bacterium]